MYTEGLGLPHDEMSASYEVTGRYRVGAGRIPSLTLCEGNLRIRAV
jgi:hypothetical protein